MIRIWEHNNGCLQSISIAVIIILRCCRASEAPKRCKIRDRTDSGGPDDFAGQEVKLIGSGGTSQKHLELLELTGCWQVDNLIPGYLTHGRRASVVTRKSVYNLGRVTAAFTIRPSSAVLEGLSERQSHHRDEEDHQSNGTRHLQRIVSNIGD